MAADHRRAELSAYDLALIRAQARRIARRASLTPDDREDLEQDLVLHALERLHLFDPARGALQTFLDRILTRRAADLRDARQTLRRGFGLRIESLDDAIEALDDKGVTLCGSAPGRQCGAFSALEEAPHDQRVLDLAALAQAFAALTPEQRDLCRHVVTRGIYGAARELRISAATVRKRMQAIRRIFRRHGFRRST